MSYEAGRWARAHTLVLDRDSTALAVLKELADDFRDIDGCCRIGSYKELALYLGIKKPDTVSAAVARLSALGLVSASNIVVGNCIVGTRFELVGYRKSDWPADRQGQSVWIEFAVSFGMEPQPWWPKLDKNEKADNPQKTEVQRKTDVPQKTGDPRKTELRHPKNGEGVHQKTGDGSPENRGTVPQKTGEGTPKNGSPYTHIRHIRQITNRYELSAPEKNSTGETSCLDTNPNPTSFFAEDEPPLPFDDVPPLDDPEGLFEPEADLPEADPDLPVIATEAQPGPESEEGKPKRKRKSPAKKAADWPVEDDGVDAETREAYLAVRKAKRVGPLTPKAYEQISEQAKKYGVSVKVALIKCIERGWVFPYEGAFEGKNYGKTQQSQQKSAFLRPQSEIDYTVGLERWRNRPNP